MNILSIALLNELDVIFCIQLNSFKYFYVTWKILFTIIHLFAHSWMFSRHCIRAFFRTCDGNYSRILRVILNKFWRQHPTKQQLYGHLLPITKTIQFKWTKHVGHWLRIRDELISNVLLWNPSHGRAKVGKPSWAYIQKLCADMGCDLENLPEAMDDREGWRERVRDIRADGATWWWWWWWWSIAEYTWHPCNCK